MNMNFQVKNKQVFYEFLTDEDQKFKTDFFRNNL